MMSKIGSSLRALALMGTATTLFSETMASEWGLQVVDKSVLYDNRVTIRDSLPHLDVYITQTEFDPPTVRVEITNENDHTLTFSKWNSPLDPQAMKKGILNAKPQSDWLDIDLPIYGLRPNFTSPCEVRKKEKAEDLMELPPWFAIQEEHVFDEESGWDLSKRHRAARLRKSAVRMVGLWHGVWNMTKEEVLKLPEREDEYDDCLWFTSNMILPRF